MAIKSGKMTISKNKKMRFFIMSQGSVNPKIRFLGQKVCSVARLQTDTQTDRHESDYRGHPFRVSGVFPSTYHQGSAQKSKFLIVGLETQYLRTVVWSRTVLYVCLSVGTACLRLAAPLLPWVDTVHCRCSVYVWRPYTAPTHSRSI